MKNQPFASPEEALAHLSETPWSNYTKADYSIEQWHSACLIHIHDGAPTSKSECKLPVKTPDGALNRNGVHAAAAALAGARGGVNASDEQKKKAANALKRYYTQLDEDPPESLAEHDALSPYDKPASPGDILEHHGVKGMRWGVRKKDETGGEPQGSAARGVFRSPKTLQKHTERGGFSPRTKLRVDLFGPAAAFDPKVRAELKEADRQIKVSKQEKAKAKAAENAAAKNRMVPGTPEFQNRVQQLTRTDKPQVLGAQRIDASKGKSDKPGLSREQKLLLTFGAVSVAAAGYYAYTKYSGNKMPNFDPEKVKQEYQQLDRMKLPAKWDVRGLKNGPISAQKLGDLTGGDFNAKLKNVDDLVVNTSRGYADILPKNGFSNPFAAEQHASVTRVLEEMRDKYPAVRNMNVEVVPMSHIQGMEGSQAHMAVLAMRAGEARVMYNDLMDKPTASVIRQNRHFLPGLGSKDYVAYHEMGHLLAAAHGDIPPAFDILTGQGGPNLHRTWATAEPLLHKRTFAQHGFTFKELSKISGYAATEPAEAMAELAGHYFTPEMRSRLTPDQLTRAEAMFNQMGGLS